jgi:hypothetical protein
VTVPWQIASVPKVFVRAAYAARRGNLYRSASSPQTVLYVKPLRTERWAGLFRFLGLAAMCTIAIAGMYGAVLATLADGSLVQGSCAAAVGLFVFGVAATLGRSPTPFSATGRRILIDSARLDLARSLGAVYDVRMISARSDQSAAAALHDLNVHAKREQVYTLAESLFERDARTLAGLGMWDASPPRAPFSLFITRITGRGRDDDPALPVPVDIAPHDLDGLVETGAGVILRSPNPTERSAVGLSR